MKLWRCDWVPSSVADWLSRELEDRGIPGTIYTHTLLSLLHPYFCPHPVPQNSYNSSNCPLETEGLQPILKSGLSRGIKVFYEEFEDYVHPDADFPDLNLADHIKEGTRRSKKRQKRKLQDLNSTPEKLWKVAALQCLLTSSDEHHSLNSIIEELFLRLKNSQRGCFQKKSIPYTGESQISIDHFSDCENIPSSAITDLNASYCFNFPPLTQLSGNDLPEDKNIIDWKTLIKNKLSPSKKATFPPKIKSPNDVRRNLESAFLEVERENIKVEMDIGFENFNDNHLHENKTSGFIPIAPDALSYFSTEECAVENNILNNIQMCADNKDLVPSNIVPVNNLPKENLEEWECAGNVLTKSEDRAVSVDLLGFRLFERTVESAGSSRCNSNGGLESFEEDRMKYPVPDGKSAGPSWGCPSDSLIEQSNQVWNSQNTFPSKLQAAIPSCIFNSFGDYPNLNINQKPDSQEYLNTQFLFQDSSWSCSREWDSMTELNSKNDSLFSSTFQCSPHTAYQRVTGLDSKTSLSEINNENAKNIWSDFNDNDIPSLERASIVSENRIKSTSTDFLRNGMEENLCETFQQLGLEQIWQNTVLPANSNKSTVVPESTNCGASSGTFQEHQCEDVINQSENLFSSVDLCSVKLSPEESEENFVLSSIPRGPSGPYVELKHTEASGFDTVVPHKGTDEVYEDSLLSEKEVVLTPKGTNVAVPPETSVPSQEEENLLTSPRTHFRPIWQDKRGSNVDEKLDEGKAFLNAISSIEDADLVFQRTESGTLFLENDRLNGSPKKYMVYLEPLIKTASNLDSSNNLEPVVSHKNQSSSSPFVPKFKIINNEKFSQTEDHSPKFGYLYDDVQSQIFQNKVSNDFFSEKPAETIWESQYPKYMKEIWEKESKILEKEAWELELTSATEVFPKWSSSELRATNWSTESNLQSSVSDSFINVSGNSAVKSKEYVNDNTPFSKIKQIWHESPIKKSSFSPTVFTDSQPTGLSEIPKTDSWDFHLSSNALIDQKYCEKKQISLPLNKNPWNVDIPLQKQEFSSIKYDATVPNHEKSENTPLWQLQWEVDQEADEILGRLIPSSPLVGSPSFYNEPRVAIQCETEDFNFMEFLEGQERQQPVEDLDNLEPGWDLNDGFEWLPTTEPGVDEEENEGREVLFYENEDGQTVMVPVEYLDDTLYDEIFGADNRSPIGGSLPDLPHGQLGEWKKLTRHAHGGRYVPPSRRPCSFFLEGNCRRSDCKFSHDLSTITCRFWEEGSCLKGETCPFRHGFLPSRRRNRSEGDQVAIINSFGSSKEGIQGTSKGRTIPKRIRGSVISVSSFELDSETDFPCLGSSIESKSEVLEEQSLGPIVKLTKLSKKKKKFITVTKNAFKDPDGDLKASASSKSRKAERHKSKRVKSQNLTESASEDCEKRNPVAMLKEKSDCESLRKILRKRSKVLSHQVYSYEDGTVSDF